MGNSDIKLKFDELKRKFYLVSRMADEVAKKDYLHGDGKFKKYRQLEKHLENLCGELFKIMDDNSELFPDKTEIKEEFRRFVKEVERKIEGKIAGLGLR